MDKSCEVRAQRAGKEAYMTNPKGHPRLPPFQTIVDKYKYKNVPHPPSPFYFGFSIFPTPYFS